MTNNTQLPDEVILEIEKKSIERYPCTIDTHDHRNNVQRYRVGFMAGAAEYATKLHIEQQAHEETRKSFKKQLNDRLHQAQQEIESLTNQLKGHASVSNENMKLLRQENETLQAKLEKYEKALRLAGLDAIIEALSGEGNEVENE